MAGAAGSPRFSYVVLYVRDVAKAMEFYTKAYGFGVRRVDESNKWGELETGATTLAFSPLEQRETALKEGVHMAGRHEPGPNIEISFSVDDVDAAFKHAVHHGAHPLAPPEPKVWGQKVGYLRDSDGIVVRLGSHVHEPGKH